MTKKAEVRWPRQRKERENGKKPLLLASITKKGLEGGRQDGKRERTSLNLRRGNIRPIKKKKGWKKGITRFSDWEKKKSKPMG